MSGKYMITKCFPLFQHHYLTWAKRPFFIIKDYIIDWHKYQTIELIQQAVSK